MAPARRPGTAPVIVGGALVVLGLVADYVGLSAQPGIGGSQLAMIGLGLAIAMFGLAARRPALRRVLARIYLIGGSLFFATWCIELALTYLLDPRRNVRLPAWSLQGLYERGELTPFHHVPDFRGTFDDGIVQVPIAINSRGDRDDEPVDPTEQAPDTVRTLLVGDSFTFGYGLADGERIDARAEHHGGGRLDAYQIGVQSYGAAHAKLRLDESAWWRGDRVYYLFFNNDLQDDNCDLERYVVFDGFVVPRRDDAGVVYDEARLREMIAAASARGGKTPRPFLDTLALPRLRAMVSQAGDRNRRLNGFPDAFYSPGNIPSSLAQVEAMRDEAKARGASFAVVILPAVGEARAGEYSQQTAAFVSGLATAGIDTIEVLGSLSGDDYFLHDPHFDASGADIAGAAIAAHALR